MNQLYRRQAKQLYRALKARGQTWTRTRAQLTAWADQFRELREDEEVSAKRIQRALDWYCERGVGALYVPLVCTGEAFRERFDELDEARKRLKDQTLRYFDDVLDYRFSTCRGTPIQCEYRKASEKLQQQIELVDDLANSRVKLPKVKKQKAVERPSKEEQRVLRRLLIVDRELVWRLLMDVPGAAEGFERRLKKAGLHKRIRRYIKERETEAAPF